MHTEEALRARRSIRKFREDEIPEKDIRSMLEAAMLAPSANNKRSWEFCVITDHEIKKDIAELHPYARHTAQAPLVIVICGREDLDPNYWVQNCAAAAENLLLQAVELGYGACWCGIYPREARVEGIRELLGITSIPFCAIPIGIPDEQPAARGFYDPERVHWYH